MIVPVALRTPVPCSAARTRSPVKPTGSDSEAPERRWLADWRSVSRTLWREVSLPWPLEEPPLLPGLVPGAEGLLPVTAKFMCTTYWALLFAVRVKSQFSPIALSSVVVQSQLSGRSVSASTSPHRSLKYPST